MRAALAKAATAMSAFLMSRRTGGPSGAALRGRSGRGARDLPSNAFMMPHTFEEGSRGLSPAAHSRHDRSLSLL